MTTREKVLDLARDELGYTESPPGSNRTKFGEWYGMNGQPWCAMFVSRVGVKAGASAFVQGARWSYCPYIEQDAQAGRYGLSVVGKSNGQPGDVVTFDWEGGVADHVGIVEKNLGGGAYQTIEGNTSTSDNSNGGQVMRRTREAAVVSMIVRYPNEGGAGGAGARVLAALGGEPMHLIHDVTGKNDEWYIAFDSGLVRRVVGQEVDLVRDAGAKTVKVDGENAHNRLVQMDAALRDKEVK